MAILSQKSDFRLAMARNATAKLIKISKDVTITRKTRLVNAFIFYSVTYATET